MFRANRSSRWAISCSTRCRRCRLSDSAVVTKEAARFVPQGASPWTARPAAWCKPIQFRASPQVRQGQGRDLNSAGENL